MSNVNPDDLRKVWEGANCAVGTSVTLYEYGLLHFPEQPMPLTQRDLERVAALAMMPPGTTVDGLGYVWSLGDAFYLYPEKPT